MRNIFRGLTAALLLATLPIAANAAVFVSVSFGPPLLPVYVPPPMPAPGYIWVPGYWAWDGDDYYWVPGTWVLPPAVGVLWTPGYWGWSDGVYVWHAGYWGPHVGFYGGINYGCGYDGYGYRGGYWHGSSFVVNNTVINQVSVNRVAFNGGPGGVVARATPEQLRAAHESHVRMSEAQVRNEHLASADKSLHASVNHGQPPVAATRQPGIFHGAGIVAAAAAGAAGAAAASHVAHARAGHTGEHPPLAHERTGHELAGHQPIAHEQPHHAVTHEPTQRALARTEEDTARRHTATHERAAPHESHPMAHESHPVAHAQAPHPAHQPALHLASAPHEPARSGNSRYTERPHGGTPGNADAHPQGHGANVSPQGRGAQQGHGSPRTERPAEHSHPGGG